MVLSEAQKQQVALWIEQGLKLSEIQTRLAAEFDVRLTYMEVRILMSELQLKPKDLPASSSASGLTPETALKSPGAKAPSAPVPEPDEPYDDAQEAAMPGGVSVSVDRVTRVGSVASGKVTFGDGQKAEWYLDQYGRLGLAPEQKGYKPSSQDVMAFQSQLQNVLSGM
jgi:hypothetical protein